MGWPLYQRSRLTYTNTTATRPWLVRSCTEFLAGTGVRGITFSSRLIFSGPLKQLDIIFSSGPFSTWAAMGKTRLLACIQLLGKRHLRAAETPACSDIARYSTAAGFAVGSLLFPAKPDTPEKGFHRSGKTKGLWSPCELPTFKSFQRKKEKEKKKKKKKE